MHDVPLAVLTCNALAEHNSYTECGCMVLVPALHVRLARHLGQIQIARAWHSALQITALRFTWGSWKDYEQP